MVTETVIRIQVPINLTPKFVSVKSSYQDKFPIKPLHFATAATLVIKPWRLSLNV